MSWGRPILTDSGGFQIMSLKGLGRVTEDGVWFRSHLDGSSHFLSPERAIEIQLALGADIVMALDECIEYPSTYETARRATKLTQRWARRAKDYYLGNRDAALGLRRAPQSPNPPMPSPASLSSPEPQVSGTATRSPVLFG